LRIIAPGVEGAYHLSVRADAESLRNIPLFRNCEVVPLQVMAFAAERQSFARGEVLIKQGQTASAAYFILNGSVDLQQDRHPLGRAEPGALLGEVAMLGGSSYSLTATAADSVQAVRIDNALFKRVATEYPEFGRAVMEALSEKLGASMRELESVRGLLTKARSFSNLKN
jgi:CRP/FNR family transcriptional regulator, cyclic AMP receptor protein